jgi:hypothetical protein
MLRSFTKDLWRFGRYSPGFAIDLFGPDAFMVKFRADACLRQRLGTANVETDAAYLAQSIPNDGDAPREAQMTGISHDSGGVSGISHDSGGASGIPHDSAELAVTFGSAWVRLVHDQFSLCLTGDSFGPAKTFFSGRRLCKGDAGGASQCKRAADRQAGTAAVRGRTWHAGRCDVVSWEPDRVD